jgi:hypothetical protein
MAKAIAITRLASLISLSIIVTALTVLHGERDIPPWVSLPVSSRRQQIVAGSLVALELPAIGSLGSFRVCHFAVAY